jgi:hypothetical protein
MVRRNHLDVITDIIIVTTFLLTNVDRLSAVAENALKALRLLRRLGGKKKHERAATLDQVMEHLLTAALTLVAEQKRLVEAVEIGTEEMRKTRRAIDSHRYALLRLIALVERYGTHDTSAVKDLLNFAAPAA